MSTTEHDLGSAEAALNRSRETLAQSPASDAESARQRDAIIARIDAFTTRVRASRLTPEEKIAQLTTINQALTRMLQTPNGIEHCALDFQAQLEQFALSENSSSFFKELWEGLKAARAENLQRFTTLSQLPPKNDGETDAAYTQRVLSDPRRRTDMAHIALGFVGGVGGVAAKSVSKAVASSEGNLAAAVAKQTERTLGAEASHLPDVVFLKGAAENGIMSQAIATTKSYRQLFKGSEDLVDIAKRSGETNSRLFGTELTAFAREMDGVTIIAKRYLKALEQNPSMATEIAEIGQLRQMLLTVRNELRPFAAMVTKMRESTKMYVFGDKMEKAFPDLHWRILNRQIDITELNQIFNAI